MTPGGKLQKGDRIRHKKTGAVCTVVKREGNDECYSVILHIDDKGTQPFYPQPPYGYPPHHMRLLEVPYWLGRTFEVVE